MGQIEKKRRKKRRTAEGRERKKGTHRLHLPRRGAAVQGRRSRRNSRRRSERATLESLALSGGVSKSRSIDRSIDLEIPLGIGGAQTREADVSAIDIEFHTTSLMPPRKGNSSSFFSFSFHRAKKRFLSMNSKRGSSDSSTINKRRI